MLRKVGLLALVLALTLLVSGAAQAKPLAGSTRASESQGVMARIWEWIGSFFQVKQGDAGGGMQVIWEEEGSHADPHGGQG
jgi:hypothetical protein